MNDVFPLLDVSVAALTFVLGFMSARHHSHLAAARALVHRLGEELEATGGGSRDRARELLLLARQGLQRDWVVRATIGSAWAWTAGNAGVALWARSAGTPDFGSGPMGVGAILISVMVASLGTWDIVAVDRQLQLLEDRTTVGLLSGAAKAAHDGRFGDVIAPTTLAASRNPTSAWPFAFRARAYVELARAATGEQQDSLRRAARRDMHRVIERGPALFAGLLDWFADDAELDLDEDVVDLLLTRLTTPQSRIHAARRLRAHVDGVLQRQFLGPEDDRRGAAPRPADRRPATRALAYWRADEVAAALATVEDLLDRHHHGLDVAETVVAARLLQLAGEDLRAQDLLDDLLPRVEDGDDRADDGTPPQRDAILLLRIACVYGMQLREAEDGSGAFSHAADRWEAAAVHLDLDKAILTLARHVFTAPRTLGPTTPDETSGPQQPSSDRRSSGTE